jgi:hypothetical protein
MAGLCSIHQKADPSCSLCQAHPRDIFPNWDEKLKQAKAAGTVKCSNCGFEFFRTVIACPKCNRIADAVVLIEVKACHAELTSEVMWFISEWCETAGWVSPRLKQNNGSFTIYAYPPKTKSVPEPATGI